MAETIDSLQVEINSSAGGAVDGIERLRTALETLKSAVKGGAGLHSVGNGMNKVNAALDGVAGRLGTFNAFINSLRELASVGNARISSSISNQLTAIGNAAGTISSASISNLHSLHSALYGLSTLPRSNIGSLVGALGRAPTALSGLNGIQWTQAANDINKLINALRPLETMGRAQGFTSTVSALARIPRIIASLDDDHLRRFDAILESVAQSMDRVSNASGNMSAALGRLPNVTARTNNLGASIANVDKRTRNWNIVGILRGAVNFVSKTISMTNEYVEDMNLFTVALGEYAESAYKYAESVSEIMGIDPAAWMRNQGIFMTLAEGFGVTSDRAIVMSRNLTQLGYDLSSFFNISSEDAMQKLQSGIAGELEPLRRLGYDLSDARLKAIAFSLGIDKATSSMNQAEKAQLRYYAIMTQVTSAQGDMSRTLSSPSNQLRVLKEQVTMAGRALGSIFIPALNAVLPVSIAVMQAIRGVATAIASLFGYSLPEVSYTAGLDSVAGSANDTASGLGNAAGAAKKLKNILMGFDELNVIPDQSGSGGGSGGAGGGSLSGFDFELPEYDFLADAVESNVDRIYKKIEPFVEWLKENIDTIGTLLVPIGTAILGWKVAKGFLPDLSLGLNLIKGIKGAAATLSMMAITVGISFALGESFMEDGTPETFIAQSLTDLLGAALTGKVAATAFGSGAGVYAASATLALTAGTSLKLAFDGIIEEGWNGKALAQSIMSVVETALAAGGVGFKIGGIKGAAIGAAIGLVIGAVASVSLALEGIDRYNINNRVKWGDVKASAEQIERVARKLFDIDVDATISVIDSTVTGQETAITKLNESIVLMESDLNLVKLGVDISPDAISTLQSSASTVVTTLTNTLAAQQETIKVSMSLAPAYSSEGFDISGAILSSVGLANDTLTTGIEALGSELGELLSKGMTAGFTAEEQLRVVELTESLSRISKAVATGEVAGSHTASTKTMLSGLDKKSALSTWSEYLTLEAELRDSLAQVENAAYASAQGQLAGLQEYLTTIDPLLDPDKYLEVSNQITELESELAYWDVPGSVEKAFLEASGPARQMWIDWVSDTFGSGNAEVTALMGEEMSDWLSFAVSMGEVDNTEVFAASFASQLDSSLKEVLGDEHYTIMMDIADKLGITGWDVLGSEFQTSVYDTLVAAIGKSNTVDLFKQLGYSIPGAIQEGVDSAPPIVLDLKTEIEQGQKGATGKLGLLAGNLMSSALSEVAAAQSQIDAVASSSTAAAKGVEKAWASTGSFIQTDVIQSIEDDFNALDWNKIGKDAARGLRAGLMSIKIPKFNLSWSTKSKSFSLLGQNMKFDIPVPNISFYAGGGFPASGELFVANENGASELVGRIGNRSAVANQDQIGDAIFQYMDAHAEENGMDEERLAAAMVSAMRSAGIGSVYIDGRRITQAINRESQRSGKPALNY